MVKFFLTLALIGFISFSQAQTYVPNGKNTDFSGYNKFSATKTKIGVTPLTETKVNSYDQLVADAADTISFSEVNFEAVRFLNTMGIPAVIAPIALELGGGVLTSAMGDGNIYYNLCLVKKTTTVTSFLFIMSTAFNGTGDKYNGIALMRQSNDTLYRITQTTNNIDIWKATAGVPTTVTLSAPVTIQPGTYVIACIYNNSAQTTAPSMQGVGATTWYNYLLPNSLKITGYSSTNTNDSIPTFVKQSAIYPTSSSYVVIAK